MDKKEYRLVVMMAIIIPTALAIVILGGIVILALGVLFP